jgi:hypothetical protein
MLRASRFSAISPLCVLTLLLLGGSPRILDAQSNWARYTPGTIGAVIQQHDSTIRADHISNKPGVIISGDDFARLARVIYKGDSRPLDSKRLEVLREWGMTFLRDTAVVQDFHREYLFQEGKRRIWLPVQDSVASYFTRELQPGQVVSLYVIWAGAYYAGKDITWTFLVNEFKAEPAKQ